MAVSAAIKASARVHQLDHIVGAAARGDFVVLLDHDDVLAPTALSELASVIAAHADVDVIYSDEDKLDELGRRFLPHFKPDWNPDLLLAYPYMGHVTAIRRDVLDQPKTLRPCQNTLA